MVCFLLAVTVLVGLRDLGVCDCCYLVFDCVY